MKKTIKEYSEEEIKSAVNVIVSAASDNDDDVIRWLLRNKLPLSKDNLKNLASLKMNHEIKYHFAKFEINDEIAKLLRKSSSTNTMTLCLIGNKSISFDLRKKWLSKPFMNLIIKDTSSKGYSWNRDFDFDKLKKTLPKDIIEEISKVLDVKDIIE